MNDESKDLKKSEYQDQEENQEIEKPSYYTILPSKVRYDNDLKPIERILFSEILLLSKKKGYCNASNGYFAKIFEKHKDTISEWISNLKKLDYIDTKIIYKDDNKTVDERRIYINGDYDPIGENTDSIGENTDTLPDKSPIPYRRNHRTPIGENTEEINTSINNINLLIQDDDDDKKKIINQWNSISELNKIESLTANREKGLGKLINTYGLDKILKAIDNITESDYLLGKTNSRPIDFDWFIRQDNFVKVLEGRYKNKDSLNLDKDDEDYLNSLPE